MTTLSLNGVAIDYGKNRDWNSHSWLFPPGSIRNIDYIYAENVVETKPGFETSLAEARFRLRNLGYSMKETRTKFNTAVAKWNRTAELSLSFDDFEGVLITLDFAELSFDKLRPFDYLFRGLVLARLEHGDEADAELEEFVMEYLDVRLILSVLAERAENQPLQLRWEHQDLVDNGWASFEDLIEVDREFLITNHTMLYGRLQDYSGQETLARFDNWLVEQGVARMTPYTKAALNGSKLSKLTLPTAVRHMIHHPENPFNSLSSADLGESIEILLAIAKKLPLPGLGSFETI